MRTLLAIIGTAAVLAGLLVGPATIAGPAGATTSDSRVSLATSASLMERDVVTLINRARARKGCPALRVIAALQTASGRHDNLMARARKLSHQLPGEPTLRRRTEAAGYLRAKMLGEVLTVGPSTPAGAVKRWMGSTSHRPILLDCRFRAVGAGFTTSSNGHRWWTVDLGRR